MARSRSRAGKKKPPQPRSPNPLLQGQVWGTGLILLGVFTLLALLSPQQGRVTRWWLDQLQLVTGWAAVLLPLLLIGFGLWGVLRSIGKLADTPRYRLLGAFLLFLALVTALHMDASIVNPEAVAKAGEGGGLLGWGTSDLLLNTLGQPLAWLVVFLISLAGLVLLAGSALLASAQLIAVWLLQRRDDSEIGQQEELPGLLGLEPAAPPLPTGESSWWHKVLARLRRPGRAKSAQQQEAPVLRIGGNGVAATGQPDASRGAGSAPQATPSQTVAGANRGPVPGSADTLIPRIIGGGRSWRLPSIDEILDDAIDLEISRDEIRERARIIEQTLADFGVPVRVVEANQGPAVTQYGLQPGYRRRRRSNDEMRREAEEILRQRGYGTARRPMTEDLIKEVMQEEVDRYERVKIKVSKIQALTNDLALALAASPIRIEAPVPGRPLVGIEVPNVQKALVSLRGVLESETFQQMKSPLRLALGQDTAGQSAVADLERMPHLLIAGATGSGKSVCVNSVIATLLLTHTPDSLRMIMIDPKMVELMTYNGIPHLLAPVVVEVERAVPILRWATGEMDRRYKLFAKEGARNLEAYNAKLASQGEPIVPTIVVIIDELADLMMVAPDDVERYVCRLAQMSRATGIHLIIATQRPSVDVVTGLIKANFPARIAFAVTSQVDSRVILDTPGAEALLGRGDMLFMRPDSSKLERLQGCFVSDTELERLVRYWKGVRITEEGLEGQDLVTAPGGMPAMPPPRAQDVVQAPLWEDLIEQQKQRENEDDLYDDAVQVVRQSGRASVSLLQRRLRVGYSRAARLIDLLEERGVVGPDLGGSRGREVLAPSKTVDSDHEGETGQGPARPLDDQSPRIWY